MYVWRPELASNQAPGLRKLSLALSSSLSLSLSLSFFRLPPLTIPPPLLFLLPSCSDFVSLYRVFIR